MTIPKRSWMSPTIFEEGGFRFFFFSREEPRMHVHLLGRGGGAKVWMEPLIQMAESHGLKPRDLREALDVIEERQDEIREAWSRHFGGGAR